MNQTYLLGCFVIKSKQNMSYVQTGADALEGKVNFTWKQSEAVKFMRGWRYVTATTGRSALRQNFGGITFA